MKAKTLTSEQLAKEIHKRYPEYYTHEIQDMLRIIPDTIEDLVSEGHSIRIMNFGTFMPKRNPNRYTKHPKTGVWEMFRGNLTLRFVAARSLLDRLKKKVGKM